LRLRLRLQRIIRESIFLSSPGSGDLQMAKIRIEIDTDTGSDEVVHKSLSGKLLPRKPIKLISTIKLDGSLRAAFEADAGNGVRYFEKEYSELEAFIKDTLDGPDRLIVTAGGLVAFVAAKNAATVANFVSLVGTEPTGNIGKCLGGVTLGSVDANSERVGYLEANGRTRSGIALFCNPLSAMNQAEERNWKNDIPGVNTTIIHGGGNGGHNNANNYDAEFAKTNQAPSAITTLVISADPFFYKSREKLIKAANAWIAAAAVGVRNVCYPSPSFANNPGNHHPTGTYSWWYGPDLIVAYRALGQCAEDALTTGNPVGFSTVEDTRGQF
jgi:hypothetical protein